jgi:hypothetical protein
MKDDEKFELLVRNVRKKQHEKIALKQLVADVAPGKGGGRGQIPSEGDGD